METICRKDAFLMSWTNEVSVSGTARETVPLSSAQALHRLLCRCSAILGERGRGTVMSRICCPPPPSCTIFPEGNDAFNAMHTYPCTSTDPATRRKGRRLPEARLVPRA